MRVFNEVGLRIFEKSRGGLTAGLLFTSWRIGLEGKPTPVGGWSPPTRP